MQKEGEMENVQYTRKALEASLKKLLMHKKIDKITISDLTED